jgi:mannose-6-phosphate isomerase-like protein (cupin superfamily)
MAATHIPFPTMPWTDSPTHPLERKKAAPHRSAALLRFEPGFADPNWCQRSHVFHVLEGALELELENEIQRIGPGEASWVDSGTRHRARNPLPGIANVVFVVSDF